MRILSVIAAITASLTATIGMAAEPVHFVHEGRTYEYRTVSTDHGRVITGRQLPGGTPFRLVVRDGRVTGTAGNTPVSFRVADAQGATAGVIGSSN